MTEGKNRQWVLQARPTGTLTGSEFRWNEAPIPRPADGEAGVPPLRVTTARKRLLVRVCLTYFASGRSALTAKALASSNRRRRKAGSSIR